MQIETERRMARLAEVGTQLEEGMMRVANILVSHDERTGERDSGFTLSRVNREEAGGGTC